MSRLHSWRLALRIARRDALRAKGRSALVVAMIALPILGVTAADLAFRSGELSPAEELTRELGEADARFSVYSSGAPILQAPVGDMTQSTGEEDWGDPVDRPPAEVEEQLTGLLPPGTRLLSDHELLGTVHTESGLLRTDVRELDAADPATEGMLTLLRGRYPERADEVAATQAFLDESGLRVGSEVRFQDDDATFRVTGAYELPDHLDRAQLVALPGAVLPRLDPRAQVAPTFLAVVPDGGVTWDTVLAANEVGLKVDSRSVILDPPPDSEVPMFADGIDIGNVATGADTTLVAGVVTVVSLVILEICLLAGPAFAVGARRSRRQLGLVGANGGDRRHLRAIMLSSGLVLGLAAAVIGIAGGIALALAAHPLIENQSHQRFGPWDFRVAELAGIGALAVLVGLLAAVIPAINAARSSVLESLTGRRERAARAGCCPPSASPPWCWAPPRHRRRPGLRRHGRGRHRRGHGRTGPGRPHPRAGRRRRPAGPPAAALRPPGAARRRPQPGPHRARRRRRAGRRRRDDRGVHRHHQRRGPGPRPVRGGPS